jgi:hypothetical protein
MWVHLVEMTTGINVAVDFSCIRRLPKLGETVVHKELYYRVVQIITRTSASMVSDAAGEPRAIYITLILERV